MSKNRKTGYIGSIFSQGPGNHYKKQQNHYGRAGKEVPRVFDRRSGFQMGFSMRFVRKKRRFTGRNGSGLNRKPEIPWAAMIGLLDGLYLALSSQDHIDGNSHALSKLRPWAIEIGAEKPKQGGYGNKGMGTGYGNKVWESGSGTTN